MPKRLTTSATNAKLLGVCGGIGEYFDVDPVLIRVIWVVATIVTGFFWGIAGYIACALIMPRPSINRDDYYDQGNQN
ncbi:MAG: PspC domain-containing protein [Defluviitaleaceae bacterium]|nr:PspC domain-containing protein [Defluviitaleaceae bacterium]